MCIRCFLLFYIWRENENKLQLLLRVASELEKYFYELCNFESDMFRENKSHKALKNVFNDWASLNEKLGRVR